MLHISKRLQLFTNYGSANVYNIDTCKCMSGVITQSRDWVVPSVSVCVCMCVSVRVFVYIYIYTRSRMCVGDRSAERVFACELRGSALGRDNVSVRCVFVCVCVLERGRKRKRERERETESLCKTIKNVFRFCLMGNHSLVSVS